MSAEKLRRALLAAMEQEEEAEREEQHRIRDAGHRADEARREERENRDSRSLERPEDQSMSRHVSYILTATGALQHAYPQLEAMDDGEERDVWRGALRIVGRQRARKLRRRGVPLMRKVEVTTRGRHRHAWVVVECQE